MAASFEERLRNVLGPTGNTLGKRVLGSRQTRRYAWASWALMRVQGLGTRRSIYRYEAVEWDLRGHARTVPSEMLGPSGTQVLVRASASAVSLNAERARFAAPPTSTSSFPVHPRASVGGEVVAVGRSVRSIRPGQMVAALGSHASLVIADQSEVFSLPPGVPAEEAAFLHLGVLSIDAVRSGELRTGNQAAVVGRGAPGHLILQLAKALGAKDLVSVARTDRHRTAIIDRLASQVVSVAEEGKDALRSIGADVTFETTGTAFGIDAAALATREGGRIVLVGDREVDSADFDRRLLQDRALTAVRGRVGAWPSNDLPDGEYREAGEHFLNLVASGVLDVGSMIDSEIDPRAAGLFYRRLGLGQHGVGTVLRWDALSGRARMRPAGLTGPIRMTGEDHPLGQLAGPKPPTASPRRASTTPGSETRTGAPVLRVALIGCGARGRLQAAACREAANADLAVVMDTSEPRARALGEQVGVPWTSDYDSVLGAQDIDAVLICSPHHVHESQAVAAARAGKHLMVEKPLAPTLEGATRIVGAAQEAGVALSVWLGFRYEPQVVMGKEFVESGGLGRLVGAQISVLRLRLPQATSGGTDGLSDWKGRWETAGGGVLLMSAIHQLDWLLYLTDVPMVEVSARFGTLETGEEVEDMVAMWARFENGALGSILATYCAPGFHRYDPAPVSFRLWGTVGHLSLTRPYQFISSRPFNGTRPERWHPLGPLPPMRPVAVEYIERFALAVREGKPPEIPGEDGLRVQAVIDAAYRSGRVGTPVPVRYPDV